MQLASTSNDIATITKLMANSLRLKPEDYTEKTIGNVLVYYYSYVKFYQIRPKDLMDMIDGILYISAYNYSNEEQIRQIKESK